MGEGTRVERLREWIPLKSTEPSTILRSADVTCNRQDLNAHKDDTSGAAVGRPLSFHRRHGGRGRLVRLRYLGITFS